ncbi:hypothetical protein MF271_05865 [Deinococcus sp. KNUC1210]|uniref:hypothetical protein n=1 Tax=Deinococcus sp. KNUC1210 TaxID=2917691 RepID=UPI001EF0DDDF|nr:hypothetical protein [Deinococcus sp. KNUC1210]ULH16145.1 hypothetical protein MF271_05865 [Deinococcus sp. KNUC1210]
MLTALIGPLLFAALGGGWAYLNRKDRRTELLFTLILFQLLGAWGYRQDPTPGLLLLVGLLALMVFSMLLHTLLYTDERSARS